MANVKVEMYTKWGCPYCAAAKSLFEKKGIAFEEYDVTMGGEKRAEMLSRKPDAMTVPQIFIDGKPYGGFDDVSAMDRAGKLDPLLGL